MPSKTGSTKQRRARKTTTPAPTKQEPVQPTQVEETTQVQDTTPQVTTSPNLQAIDDLAAKMTAIIASTKEALGELKNLRKVYLKEVKQLQKAGQRRRRAHNSNAAPSGINRPVKISAQLCKFLGVPAGSELASVEVTKRVWQYVSENKLKGVEVEKDGNKVLDNSYCRTDRALQGILAPLQNEEKHYQFNKLRRYLSHHFEA